MVRGFKSSCNCWVQGWDSRFVSGSGGVTSLHQPPAVPLLPCLPLLPTLFPYLCSCYISFHWIASDSFTFASKNYVFMKLICHLPQCLVCFVSLPALCWVISSSRRWFLSPAALCWCHGALCHCPKPSLLLCTPSSRTGKQIPVSPVASVATSWVKQQEKSNKSFAKAFSCALLSCYKLTTRAPPCSGARSSVDGCLPPNRALHPSLGCVRYLCERRVEVLLLW